MTPTHAVIYCRVSTKEQVQNFSLSTQEKECRAWSERNGYAVDRVFGEEGESAKTTERPAFQEMLAYCQANKKRLAVVVVHRSITSSGYRLSSSQRASRSTARNLEPL